MPNDAPLHLVDPELAPALAAMPTFELTLEVLPGMRAASAGMVEAMAAMAPALERPVEVAERWIHGPPGAPDVRVLTYRPSNATTPMGAFLHIHGGGYVAGTADINDVQSKATAAALGCVVVSVDYRLAPETAHPGPVEDCYAALKWLHGEAATLGVDPGRIAVGGESAGGGLAAALAVLARDRGEISVCFQCLTYPMIDDRTVTRPDPHPFAGHHIWTPSHNRFGWSALLGRDPGGEDVSPYAAAARTADPTGLPPALIVVGALDLFLEEDIEYARRLLRAGVPTELHVYPGAFHAFDLAPQAAVSQAMVRDRMAALGRALAARP